MGQVFTDQVGVRSNLLMKLRTVAESTEGVSLSGSQYQGEVSFIARASGDETDIELQRLGIVGRGVETPFGPTGKLSIQGVSGHGKIALTDRGWECSTEIKAQVIYRAIEKEKGFRQVEPGRFQPDFAIYTGQINAMLRERKIAGRLELVVVYGNLSLTYSHGGLDWLQALVVPLKGLPLGISKVATEALAVTPCSPERQTLRRQLRLRPVFFSAGGNDPAPTGSSWNTQLAKAQEIWGRCCLDLAVMPEHVVLDPALKVSQDASKIRNAYEDPASDIIEVFLVDSDLPNGGGVSFSAGSGLAKIIITDRNAGNPTLLAHELGHILGGLHPGSAPNPPSWIADPGTVLQPSGSPNHPNPERNTLHNCQRIDNAALVSTGQSGCIQPT